MPEKTVESNRLKVSCFDKTGTLTENNIDLDKIYLYDKGFNDSQLINKSSELLNLMVQLFGTCHTVRNYGGQLLGDEVDLRMYQFSKFSKANISTSDIYLNTQAHQDESLSIKINPNQNPQEYEVIKVHQFESRFQSMSVLVHDRKMNKFYCFSKGAP